MGVVSFYNILEIKEESVPDALKNFTAVNLALDDLFRTIALQKNKILYAPDNYSIPHRNYQTHVILAAQKLLEKLQFCMSEDTFAQELTSNIQTLEGAIMDYKKNEMALSQIILVCSSIKMSLGKKLFKIN